MPCRQLIAVVLMLLSSAPAAAQIADESSYLADLVAELPNVWPDNRRVRIVCHGHSVPTGYFAGGTVRPFDAYPHLLRVALKERYPQAVVQVITTSIGGEHSEQGAKRFERDVLALWPDVVTIDYALNDRRIGIQRARAAWESMIAAAKQAGVKVLLMSPTPDIRNDLFDDSDSLPQHANQVWRLAYEHHTGFVDSFSEFRRFVIQRGDIHTLMASPNHPNRAGHELVVPELLKWFDGPVEASADRAASLQATTRGTSTRDATAAAASDSATE